MKNSILSIAGLIVVAAALFAETPEPKKNDAPPTPKAEPGKGKPGVTSIAIRVRRVTYEDAYVGVPVTKALFKKNADGTVKQEADGTARLDVEALLAEAVRISKDPKVEWKVESTNTEGHPTQQQPPEGRGSFDPSLEKPAK